jgi:protocatechuate 3,4-dioxygenase beta subunit
MTIVSRRAALIGIGSSALLLPGMARAQLKPTPTADIGPFYPIVRGPDEDGDLTMIGRSAKRAIGQVIEVSGRVIDKAGRAVPGARIELWQANAAGRYMHPADTNSMPLDPNFQGFAKLTAGREGGYRYTTIKPGAYPDGDESPRPPHIHLDIFGSKDRIVTQMLFPGEPLNAGDDVVPEWARARLTAKALGQGTSGALRFEWDVILDAG